MDTNRDISPHDEILRSLVIQCAYCRAFATWPRAEDHRSFIRHNGACENHDELIVRLAVAA